MRVYASLPTISLIETKVFSFMIVIRLFHTVYVCLNLYMVHSCSYDIDGIYKDINVSVNPT